ncbi:MAG: bifunctional adenosylcobinamide kinase/adenosylcobinamide-phosphate guanylyltransferase [Angelakisella sp.]
MTFIFGGAYQGKLDIAMERTGLSPHDCCDCREGMNLSCTVLNHFEQQILRLVEQEGDVASYMMQLLPQLSDKVIIMDDLSAGVVPMDATLRRWREETGRCAVLLSKNAHEVLRVFCGIATKLK